jgi:hypothetical protein
MRPYRPVDVACIPLYATIKVPLIAIAEIVGTNGPRVSLM